MYYKNSIFSTRKKTFMFLLDYMDTKQKVRSERSTKKLQYLQRTGFRKMPSVTIQLSAGTNMLNK
jgi:hypothetical protein